MRMLTDVLDDLRRENERLTAQLAEARAALTSIRDQTYVDAEGPELRAQNEMNHRKASDALNALAPAPPGAVLVSREDAEEALRQAFLEGFECVSWAEHEAEWGPQWIEARRLLGLPVEGQ